MVPTEDSSGWLQTGVTGPEGLLHCTSYWVEFLALCLTHGKCLKQWATSRMDELASLPTCWEFKMGASLSNHILTYERKANIFMGHTSEQILKGISGED